MVEEWVGKGLKRVPGGWYVRLNERRENMGSDDFDDEVGRRRS